MVFWRAGKKVYWTGGKSVLLIFSWRVSKHKIFSTRAWNVPLFVPVTVWKISRYERGVITSRYSGRERTLLVLAGTEYVYSSFRFAPLFCGHKKHKAPWRHSVSCGHTLHVGIFFAWFWLFSPLFSWLICLWRIGSIEPVDESHWASLRIAARHIPKTRLIPGGLVSLIRCCSEISYCQAIVHADIQSLLRYFSWPYLLRDCESSRFRIPSVRSSKRRQMHALHPRFHGQRCWKDYSRACIAIPSTYAWQSRIATHERGQTYLNFHE